MSYNAPAIEEAYSVDLKVLPDPSEREQPKSNRADDLAKRAEWRVENLRLAKAAQGGCIESFESLVKQFEKPLYHFLLIKTRNHHQAEDLLQDTFLITFRKLYRFNPAYPFSSWIFTIANRLAISHFRKQKPVQEEIDIPTDKTPRCEAMAAEASETLWEKARHLLSDNHYTALWLFYTEGKTIEEVATTMNRKPNSVKVWLHRARNRLAQEFKSRPSMP
ncbi:MAG: sigma-70 family RNA polymerase sigma factor [Verrucomicrobiota bacterium]|jgi:RNA polymerase sigma-70 factor (ECF subfamily)|nr:sigma-70 family RNA polymerase sigma factor [Verrucomicrobiota bacterium]MDP7050941.1 sigma-70 family RNA polymerase sigma factor [Verrucomicrobiota bacterium]